MQQKDLTRVPDPMGIFQDPKGTVMGILALGAAGGAALGAVRLGNATLGDSIRNGVPNAWRALKSAGEQAQEEGESNDFPFY